MEVVFFLDGGGILLFLRTEVGSYCLVRQRWTKVDKLEVKFSKMEMVFSQSD